MDATWAIADLVSTGLATFDPIYTAFTASSMRLNMGLLQQQRSSGPTDWLAPVLLQSWCRRLPHHWSWWRLLHELRTHILKMVFQLDLRAMDFVIGDGGEPYFLSRTQPLE